MPDPLLGTRRWEEILDRLEDDARSARENTNPNTDATVPLPWTAPTDVGAIPAALLERARRVNAAQLEAARRLASRRDSTRQHLSALRGLSPISTESVYLDVHG